MVRKDNATTPFRKILKYQINFFLMKIKSTFLLLGIIIILQPSCLQKKEVYKTIPKISLIPSKISECYIENMMDTFYFVPLATSNDFLIGHISELFFTGNDIIVKDNSQGTIFVFDRQGNPKHKISAWGKGPGQHNFMSDVFFDEKSMQFEILDKGKKVLYYSFDGNFLYDKKINDSRLAGFRFTKNNGMYIFDRGQFNFDGMRISIYDEASLNFVKSYLPIPKQILNLGWSHLHTFDTYLDSLYYIVPMMDDKIYIVTLDSLIPAYELDYPGKTSIDLSGSEILREKSKYDSYMASHEQIYSVSNLFINDHYISFNYKYKNLRGPIKIFYSKATGKFIQFYELKSLDNPNLRILSGIIAKDGEYFAIPIHGTLNKFLPKNISRKLDENSNPVLLFFKLKDF